MSESIHEQIEESIRTRLAGIVGDGGATFWFTPEKVIRHPFTQQCLDASLSAPVYVLTPDEEEDEEEGTGTATSGGSVRSMARLDLVVAVRFDGSDLPFDTTTPRRGTLQNRMVRDVKKKLREDVTLGGLTSNLEFVLTDRSPETTYYPKWAIVFMRLLVKYSYFSLVPGP